VTAAAAMIAGLAVVCSDHFTWKTSSLPFFAAFLLALCVTTIQAKAQERERATSAHAFLADVLKTNGPVANRTVRLVVFTRTGCHYCDKFEQEFLPFLQKRFGAALEVERHMAQNQLPTPSFIILGTRRETLVGLPKLEVLQDAITRSLSNGVVY
jgi:hypothetical protein